MKGSIFLVALAGFAAATNYDHNDDHNDGHDNGHDDGHDNGNGGGGKGGGGQKQTETVYKTITEHKVSF